MAAVGANHSVASHWFIWDLIWLADRGNGRGRGLREPGQAAQGALLRAGAGLRVAGESRGTTVFVVGTAHRIRNGTAAVTTGSQLAARLLRFTRDLAAGALSGRARHGHGDGGFLGLGARVPSQRDLPRSAVRLAALAARDVTGEAGRAAMNLVAAAGRVDHRAAAVFAALHGAARAATWTLRVVLARHLLHRGGGALRAGRGGWRCPLHHVPVELEAVGVAEAGPLGDVTGRAGGAAVDVVGTAHSMEQRTTAVLA